MAVCSAWILLRSGCYESEDDIAALDDSADRRGAGLFRFGLVDEKEDVMKW